VANMLFELDDDGVAYKLWGTNHEDVEAEHSHHRTPLVRREVKFKPEFFGGSEQFCWVLGRLAFYEIP